MEEIIITICTGIIIGMGFIGAPKINQKQQERKEIKAEKAKADAWQARLEEARLARESHPEDYVPGSVELPSYV